eukprot:GHRR01026353.1.p1 GENE.GHRR01026353.1~~GHRR01026353.1.p1  ORF type:complete len:141 (+),score=21.83 GHRR01026353.1:225-647(+)
MEQGCPSACMALCYYFLGSLGLSCTKSRAEFRFLMNNCKSLCRASWLPFYTCQGPSFTVHGNLVRWQKWSFRVGFNYREGLVLHQLGYQDGDVVRPVMHRGSLVEMAVPYGDPRYGTLILTDYGCNHLFSSLRQQADTVL